MRQRMRSKRSLCQRSHWMLVLLGTIGGAVVSLSLPRPALADGITGRVQLTYNHSDTRSKDLRLPFLPADDVESRTFVQQYHLNLDKSLAPNLKLFATGMFQKSDFVNITNGEQNTGTSTVTRPYVDLTLRTPLYTIGANYNNVTTESRSGGGPSFTTIHEAYTGIVGWKPVELPTVNLTASRSYDYDKERLYRDTVSDQLNLYMTYDPVRTVNLRYRGTVQDFQDRKTDVETQTTAQSGRIMYADQFFQSRFSINGYYDYSERTTETTTSGGGSVDVQLFAVDGLSVNSNIPTVVRLSSSPFLIDATTTGPANSANNIGTDTYPLDTAARNVGLQFAVATQLNTLNVFVSSLSGPTLATAIPAYLPNTVSQSFRWDVYTSADNQNWTLLQAGASAPYEIDITAQGVGRFQIAIPNVTTRYIKVVVSPLLPPAAGGPTENFPGVYVTEVQAFIAVSAADIKGRATSTTQIANVNSQVRLYQTPSTSLTYDLTFNANQSDSEYATSRTSSLTNALSLGHRFNVVFSGNARVMRTDETDTNGTAITQEFSTQILANPIRTLSHSLGYTNSTRQSQNGLRSTNESLYMSNTAELYRNITAYLNGGVSTATGETELKTDSSNYSWGVNVIPIKTMNINLSSSVLKSEQTGPHTEPESTRAKSSIVSVSYYPYSLLYLFASWQKYTTDENTDTIKNYGLNWSPFPGGNLQLNFSYNETLQLRDNTVVKSMSPTARWIITRGANITAAYTSATATSDIRESTSRTVYAALNIVL